MRERTPVRDRNPNHENEEVDGVLCNSPKLFMKRALDLASLADGFTAPNPLVGAVIVYNDRIIGEGYHHQAGTAHAEVHAFDSVVAEDRSLLPHSTLYVTLEPCCHQGETPPCTERILKEGIQKVVVAMEDPFPQVKGKGIQTLRQAGVQVEVGLLGEEAERLNAVFLTNVRLQRPFITLKWAESLDGFIDGIRTSVDTPPVQFSPTVRLRETHRLRHLHEAILVGANTFLLDNPSLTNRYWWGKSPLRIVLDSRESVFRNDPIKSKLFKDPSSPIWIISPKPLAIHLPSHVTNICLPRGKSFLSDLMALFYKEGIQSLLVEGGTQVLRAFLEVGLYDAIDREVAPFMLHQGVFSPTFTHL